MLMYKSIYEEWMIRDLWTMEQAIKLAIGHHPAYWLNGKMKGFEDSEDNDEEIIECIDQDYSSLEEKARLALLAKKLEFICPQKDSLDFSVSIQKTDKEGCFLESEWAGKVFVSPRPFLLWAMEKEIQLPEPIVKLMQDEKILVSKQAYETMLAKVKDNITEPSVPNKQMLKKLGRPIAHSQFTGKT